MTFYALSSAQFCLRKGDRRISLAHWMAIFRDFSISWMQHSCSWLVGKCSSRFDNWFNCPSLLCFKDTRSFHQKHLRGKRFIKLPLLPIFDSLRSFISHFFDLSLQPGSFSLNLFIPSSCQSLQVRSRTFYLCSHFKFSLVYVCLFPDLTSWICSSLLRFTAALAKT